MSVPRTQWTDRRKQLEAMQALFQASSQPQTSALSDLLTALATPQPTGATEEPEEVPEQYKPIELPAHATRDMEFPAEPEMSMVPDEPTMSVPRQDTGQTRPGAAAFVKGMIARGWTPEEAAAVAGNVHAESGFKADIQERAPLAGRGGYGYIQWTGPRRVALERYAAITGKDIRDPNVQMDFLNLERTGESVKYGGPDERYSYQKAFAGGGTPAAIAERFGRYVERPARLEDSVETRREMAERYYRGAV